MEKSEDSGIICSGDVEGKTSRSREWTGMYSCVPSWPN